MKKLGKWCNKRMMRRIASAALALILFVGILPTSFMTTEAHWTDEYINTLVDWGVMRGDVSGNMNAEKKITRAEFVAMVNRAFGYTADTTHPFTDVTTRDWFNNDIGMAFNMGYFKGTSETTASPNSHLTREQAVVLIGRNLLLDEKLGEALGFSDSRTFSEWSRGMVESAISAGFIGGYDDGSFQPQREVTRGEVAAMLVKAIGTMVNKPGTHELGGVYGNVMISSSGVKLKNTTIAGDLYITGGLELGDVMLENVTVLGKIIVSGAGESHKGDSSIVLRNVEAGELVVDSIADQFVTLRAEGNTQIDFTNVKTSAYLDDQTKVGDGLLYIEMNGEPGMNVTLAGNIEEVLNRTAESELVIAQGTAQIVTMDEKATDSLLDIKNIASVNELNLDVGTSVTGEGDVKDIFINAAGSEVEMLPDKIEIRPGLTADINGEEMDTKEGQESSSEPRILSGYPKIKNLAPNSVEVVFSANKKGTIHWALTSLIDGPVGVEDLLEVKDYNTKILQQGKINVTESNKEFTIKISKLLSDGSYYVSAVLVDSRDQKSPVKYVTFTTPDGTAPAFATGYPELTQIKMDTAQVAVMPTKTSTLYYAVLPKGAAAPTIAEFKAGAISGDLGNCPKEGIPVYKNVITLQDITAPEKLEELKSYELYLCLIDPDNGKDSGVKRLTFTTVDGTPPELADAIPTGVQNTSIKLTTSMNEAGVIYWVAVKEGQTYPVLPNNLPEDSDLEKIKQLQVINGMGNVIKAGRANAAANKDVVLNITGLTAESSYDIYYVAQDAAGNCSEVKMINQKTLDTSAPTARQEFTKTSDAAGLEPLPETDIKIIFSETVRDKDNNHSLVKLYDEYKKQAPNSDDAKSALADLVNDLKKAVQLWDVSNVSAAYQVDHDPSMTADDVGTWINYEKVEIEVLDTGEMVITFKHGEAISLSSGSTYQFVLENITDTSDTQNPMKPNPYKLDPFTTVFAQVNLTSRASSGMNVGGLPYERGKEIKDDDGSIIYADADMRFWMNPQSTESINSNVYFDMWIETSNVIIYFDLYCRVIDSTIQNAADDQDKVVKDATKISMFGDNAAGNASIFDQNGWIYLGNMNIGASGGTVRSSVNGLINGKNVTSVPQLNSLNQDYTYEFIIDVTTINESTDEQSWSEDVKLNILIPAGQDLSGTDYAKDNPWTNDVVNIGNPKDFSVSRKFIDTKTPQFRDGYPTFGTGDSAVNMNIMLDRAGTLYYVVAPLVDNGAGGQTTSIATTVLNGTTEVPFEAWFDLDVFPPTTGKDLDNKKPLGDTYTLAAPTKDGVALLVDKGAGDVNIKTGKQSIGVTRQTIKVTELMPETTYIVYAILKGESQEYSDVYLFQFTTTEVDTPTIELNLADGGSSVQATTSTTAELSWALYTNTVAEQIFGTMYLSDYLKDTANVTQFEKDCAQVMGNAAATDISILNALTKSLPGDKKSIFDIYGNDYIKDYVLKRIQMEASTYEQPVDMGDKSFDEMVPGIISPGNMSAEVVYYIITAARHTMGESYGFKAQSGLHLADIIPPELRDPSTYVNPLVAEMDDKIYDDPISDALSTDPRNYYYKGSVTITFSERIYMLKKKTDDNNVDSSVETERVYIDEKNFKDYVTARGLELLGVSVSGGTITIDFRHATIGSSIVIFKDGSICDAAQNVMTQGARLQLTFVVGEADMGFLDNFGEPTFEVKWID